MLRINLVSISHPGSMSPSPAQPGPAVWAASHLLQPVSGSQPRAEPLQTQAQTRSTMSLIIDSVIFAQVPIVLARILDMGNDFPRKC